MGSLVVIVLLYFVFVLVEYVDFVVYWFCCVLVVIFVKCDWLDEVLVVVFEDGFKGELVVGEGCFVEEGG